MKKLKYLLIALICLGLIGGYYLYLSTKDGSEEENIELTEVQNLILTDLEKSYPPTAREVVVVYNRYLEALHNEEYTDEEFEQLVDHLRLLMDDELLEQNPRDIYIVNLEAELAVYKENEQTIRYSNVSESASIKYKTIDGREYAYVDTSYLINDSSGTDLTKTNQQYVLRTDTEDERWKILGFALIDGESE